MMRFQDLKTTSFKYFVPVSVTFMGVAFRFVALWVGLAYLNKLMPGLEICPSSGVTNFFGQFVIGLGLIAFVLLVLQQVSSYHLLQVCSYIIQAFLVVYVCAVAYVYVHYQIATTTQFLVIPGVSFYKTSWGQLELLQILQQHIVSSGSELPTVGVLSSLVGSSPTPEGVIRAYEDWLLTPPELTEESTAGWLDWLSAHQELIVGCVAALTTLVSLAALGYKVYSIGSMCASLVETCKSLGVDPDGVTDLSSRVDELCKSVTSARTENLTLSRSIGEIRLNLAEFSHRTTPALDKLFEKTASLDEKTTYNLASINELYKVSSFLIEKVTGIVP